MTSKVGKGRQIKRLVRLPVHTRFVTFVGMPPMIHRTALKVVDGVGLYVYYCGQEMPTDDQIRACLIGGQETWVLVEAETAEEAIEKFPTDYPAAAVGERAKALELDVSDRRQIEIYPPCPRMWETPEDSPQIVCGKPRQMETDKSWWGSFGGCVLDGFDGPHDCPIDEYRRKKPFG